MATGAAARYGADSRSGRGFVDTTGALQDLSDVAAEDAPRIVTGLSEFDRVMGGGLVKGGVSLIGGDPGIGKSTLLLQVMAAWRLRGSAAFTFPVKRVPHRLRFALSGCSCRQRVSS